MKLEEIGSWRQFAHTMTAIVELIGITQLFHAVEIVIPAEKLIKFEIQVVANFFRTTRYYWVHK